MKKVRGTRRGEGGIEIRKRGNRREKEDERKEIAKRNNHLFLSFILLTMMVIEYQLYYNKIMMIMITVMAILIDNDSTDMETIIKLIMLIK